MFSGWITTTFLSFLALSFFMQQSQLVLRFPGGDDLAIVWDIFQE